MCLIFVFLVYQNIILLCYNKKSPLDLTSGEVKKASHKLFQCHKSYLINPDNVVSLDKKEVLVYFVGGKSCYVSKKRMKELKTKLES